MKLMIKSAIACFAATLMWQSSPSYAIGEIGATTPQEQAMLHQEDVLSQAGEDALRSGDYLGAEKDFRAINALDRLDAESYRGLAEALTGQGRLTEAEQAYQTLIYQDPFKWSSTASELRVSMRYAILLTQIGKWEDAVSVYQKALPNAIFGEAPKVDDSFDSHIPMPMQLQAMAHIACGMQYTGNGETKEAFKEYEKAAYLVPDSALASYYYGYGWQKLSPLEQATLGTAQQAKAALRKAVKLGKGPVKAAAQKALQVAMKAK